MEQFDFFEGSLDHSIIKFFERVKVLPDGALNHERCLGNVSDAFSEQMEANGLAVNTVNQKSAIFAVSKPEQNLEYRRFSSASPAYDADFHSRLHRESEVLDSRIQMLSIPHCDIIKDDLTLARPSLVR